jgi:hypothetical protein
MEERQERDVQGTMAPLAAKIAKVQLKAEVQNLPKRTVTVQTQKGGTYSYDYIEEATLQEVIRPLLAEEGVATLYSDEIKSIQGNMATVKVTLTLIDGESGAWFQMNAEGVGTDMGDKHVNKAKTSAMRYLLWKWFLVPSGDVDPEAESIERSEKPPKSQIKWAKKEDVEAFIEEVAAAGFQRQPTEEAAAQEFAEWEGYRADWFAKQRRAFEGAKKQREQEPVRG